MNFKEGIIGGTSVIGGGSSVGGVYLIYSQPDTIGEVLKESGDTLLSLGKNSDKLFWTLLIVRYREDKSDFRKFPNVEVNDIGASKLNSLLGRFRNQCRKYTNISLTGNNSVDDVNIEIARRWCTIPDDVAAGVLLEKKRIPIILETSSDKQNDLWKKAYDKFFVESSSTDKFGTLKGKEDERDKGEYDDNDYKVMQSSCEELLRKSGLDNTSDNREKASKWCVLFTSAGAGKKLKESDTNWGSKFSTASTGSNGDPDLKKILEKFKSNNSNDETKAMKKWCKIAMNIEDRTKAKLDQCIFET